MSDEASKIICIKEYRDGVPSDANPEADGEDVASASSATLFIEMDLVEMQRVVDRLYTEALTNPHHARAIYADLPIAVEARDKLNEMLRWVRDPKNRGA